MTVRKYNTKRIDFNHEIYNFIIEYFKKNMLVPTIREIIKGTSYMSSSTVYDHMKRLLEMGMLNQIGDRYCLPKETVVHIISKINGEV